MEKGNMPAVTRPSANARRQSQLSPESRVVSTRNSAVGEMTLGAEQGPLVTPFATGDIIADKYEVVDVLGAGGVAYVISALHLELGEMVALKFLRPESLVHEEVVARFASEARAVARIKSEHVAHVFDVGSLPDGGPFIVMEYLEGKDLANVLAERGKLPIKVAVDYVMQTCEALACAHASGIVHRDIKPENLFLTQQAGSVECIKVLDFGISKSALGVDALGGGRKHAKTMLPMGTPGYMSPEQIRACGAVDARTDIWALGCVLYELLTGATAFDAPTQMQLSAAILERSIRPLRKLLPEAPAELEAILNKCLEKDVEARYRDVAELARVLYPFGQRRSRLSAERCAQMLHAAHGGALVEFNSVAPPPSLPTRIDTPKPVSTGSPAAVSLAQPQAFAKKSRTLPFVIAGMVAATLAMAGFHFSQTSAEPPAGAGTPAAAVAPPPRAAELPTARVEAPATKAGGALPSAAVAAPSEEEAPAAASGAKRPTAPQRSRAAIVAAQRAAAAAAAKTAAPAPKRAAPIDDSEPDVGY
jgi:serine/threonine-protein kinase